MPRWRRFVWFSTVLILAAAHPLAASNTEVFSLSPRGGERLLPPGDVHAYPVDLRADEYVHLNVEQLGVDVELRLFDPAGKLLLRIDSPTGDRGAEELFFLAPRAGRYRAEVALRWGPAGGRYRIAVVERRPATAVDRRRAAALAAFSRGGELSTAAAKEEAAAAYRQAADLWRGLREESRRGLALQRLAELRFSARALEAALTAYREAFSADEAAGDRHGQAVMHNEIGRCLRGLAQPAAARASYEKALALWRLLGDRRNEANTLENLAVLSHQQGDYQEALGSFGQELALWKSLGDSQGQAKALVGMGRVFSSVGEGTAAQQHFQQAMELLRNPGGDPALRAGALAELANAFYDEGAPRSALLPLRTALGLQRKIGETREEAVTLIRLGRVYHSLGDRSRAADYHRRALQLFRQIGARDEEAKAWSNLGWIAWAAGRPREALDAFERALPVARAYHNRELEAATLHGMARAERLRGNPIAARKRILESLAIIESVRGELAPSGFQLSYFAKKEDYYTFLIDLLMEQHRLRPADGDDLVAFEVSERARARSLLDKLQPGAFAAPLALSEIQRRVLDRDTLLLEYYVSEPRSYLWIVSSAAVASYELPGRASLERQVGVVLAALSRQASNRHVADLRLNELGRALLAPVAGQLGGQRILVVPHGVLEGVPFEALTDPIVAAGGPAPLLLRHEVIVISSASVLAALRRRSSARQPAPDALALFADPVIAPDDPRLPPAARRSPLPLGGRDLPRLRFAGDEAAAILRLAPARGLLRAIGLAANRELALSGVLERYRILHFATHGLFDDAQPDLAALVLSRFDAAGRPRNGLLRPRDIEGLHLTADLVVLSACRTALGRRVPGEGLVGLARSFLAAGAGRVLVSLWNVDDRATAVLMERFYQRLMGDSLPPAAALRQAQLSMWREERWRSPYLWAGFLLHGDWD
jgi:CHAT domain-containing protein/Tfp pilus assembly protein PilF